MTRDEELAESLTRVQSRVRRAAEAAGRSPAELTLVAVTKFFPLSDVEILSGLGVRDMGESREQELRGKADALPDLTWHFLGVLQTNKARSVGMRATLVHSLDRPELVAPLARGAEAVGRRLEVLVQVSLDGDRSRGGALADEVPELAAAASSAGLVVRGVMAVAPLGADSAEAFTRLVQTSQRLREQHPDATVVSAGMSGDLEAAVAAGATHLRVGTALLGSRPVPGH